MSSTQEHPIRRILTIDGGGVRGILALKLLERLEARITSPSYDIRNSANERPARLLDLFDMVAGTSTGAMIVGLLQIGYSPREILRKYRDLLPKIFKTKLHSGLSQLFGTKYSQRHLKRLNQEQFGDTRLWQLPKDIMIVARDMVRSESTFFTAFKLSHSDQIGGPHQVYGTFKTLRLRDAVMASLSAPTLFPSYGRFVDGGVGSFNNPCLQAVIEALVYSAPSEWESWVTAHPNQPPPCEISTWKRHVTRYQPDRVIVYSFGTGHLKPQRSLAQVAAMKLWAWARSISVELLGDISELQSKLASGYIDILRAVEPMAVLTPTFRLHRYQLYLTPEGISDIGGKWDPAMASIAPDQVACMDLLEELGDQMANTITAAGLWDEEELVSVPEPRPSARRVPSNVFLEFGRPSYDMDYTREIIEEMERIGR